jgi:hypothetical protein
MKTKIAANKSQSSDTQICFYIKGDNISACQLSAKGRKYMTDTTNKNDLWTKWKKVKANTTLGALLKRLAKID